MNGLTPRQLRILASGINESRVAHVKGMAHLEAWDVRRYLIKIFGYGGWDFQLLDVQMVSEVGEDVTNNQGQTYFGYTVVYRATGRLIVKDRTGNPIASYDDAATGDGPKQRSLSDAHDLALKTAASQALKRCAVNLGDQFGLSLYNNGSLRPVVGTTLVPENPDGDAVEAAHVEPVASSEHVEHVESSQDEEPPRLDVEYLSEWTDKVDQAATRDELNDIRKELAAAGREGGIGELDAQHVRQAIQARQIELDG